MTIKAVKPMTRPLTLDAVKSDPMLSEMALVKSMRLSVQPVTEAEWAHILTITGTTL